MKWKQGFTLIELMIVISIIGILTSIGMVSFSQARTKANIAKTTADLNTIRTAMIWYKLDYGELPPTGDFCSNGYCTKTTTPTSDWANVITILVNGKYLSTRIDKDAWGNYFVYDDNDCNSNPGESYVVSAGSDKKEGGSDDIRLLITPGC